MGDCQNEDLRLGFDRRVKLKFLGSQITTSSATRRDAMNNHNFIESASLSVTERQRWLVGRFVDDEYLQKLAPLKGCLP
jgi:hypothetical protein